MQKTENIYDCTIVGGGTAGLSAALALGRARMKTLVCDQGNPRNEPAHNAHNFFTRDGTPPLELLRIGREQLKIYETVNFQNVSISKIEKNDARFVVTFEDGSNVVSRTVLLACGVRDEFPPIENFEAFWGKSIFHCPFCHAFEMRDLPLAVVGTGEHLIEMTGMLRNWSRDLIVLTNGAGEIPESTRDLLEKYEIPFFIERIKSFAGTNGKMEKIILETGEEIARKGVWLRPLQSLRSDFAAKLGCELTETGHIKISPLGETNVAGVYAAGDVTSPMQSLAVAVMQGNIAAAAGIVRTLSGENFK